LGVSATEGVPVPPATTSDFAGGNDGRSRRLLQASQRRSFREKAGHEAAAPILRCSQV